MGVGARLVLVTMLLRLALGGLYAVQMGLMVVERNHVPLSLAVIAP